MNERKETFAARSLPESVSDPHILCRCHKTVILRPSCTVETLLRPPCPRNISVWLSYPKKQKSKVYSHHPVCQSSWTLVFSTNRRPCTSSVKKKGRRSCESDKTKLRWTWRGEGTRKRRGFGFDSSWFLGEITNERIDEKTDKQRHAERTHKRG